MLNNKYFYLLPPLEELFVPAKSGKEKRRERRRVQKRESIFRRRLQ